MEEDKQLSRKYINTPFAYAKAQKGLTLLQQNVMVRVVAHLQHYLEKFFKNPELRNADEDPKPIMTEADRLALPPVRIELSELGISSGTYSRVREAMIDVLAVNIEKNTVDKDGKPVKRLMKLFSKIDVPVTDKKTTVRKRLNKDDEELTEVKVDRTRGYVDIYLNKDVLWEMFDMNQGYVSHPEDIARIGKVDNMPLMYYLIRHKMLNFKLSKAKVDLVELREYLGMIKRDTDGKIIKVQYPRYSQFKTRIIMTALNDIRRVCDAGQIDFYFDMKEVRPRGKKTGDPDYLEFTKVAAKKTEDANYRKASEKKLCNTLVALFPTLDDDRLMKVCAGVPEELWDEFKSYAYNILPKVVEKPHRWDGTMEDFVFFVMNEWVKQHTPKPASQEQPLMFTEDVPGLKEWQTFLATYKGNFTDKLRAMTFLGIEGNLICFGCTQEARDELEGLFCEENRQEAEYLMTTLARCFGRRVSFKYRLR